MPAVFISYSRRDSEFVHRLHDSLVARSYDVWVDWEDIPPSAEWFGEIQAGVRSADGVIYVISPDSVSSEICTRELNVALDQNKRIVPVVCREPGSAAVPERAAALNWVFLRDGDDFDTGVGKLTEALETDLEYVRTHTRLGVQAGRWEASGHDSSQLLRGTDLSAAEAWLVSGTGKQPEATQPQREYLLASRQAATRRQRTVIGAVSFALVIAVVLAIVALVQRSTAIHERDVAQARQLDADAQANYASDPELSVLLAVRAAKVQDNSQTVSTLRQSLATSQVRARYLLPTASAGDVLPSQSSNRLLLTGPGAGSSAWARIYVPGATRAAVSLPGPPSPASSAWDAAGNRVVIGGAAPVVYDASTGHALFRVPTPALHTALNAKGTTVVTVDLNAVGHVYDVATGRQLAVFHPRYTGGTDCFALSPNGRFVAQCDSLTLSQVIHTPADLDVWSTRTGRLVRSVHEPSLIGSVAFSPDSHRFVLTTTAAQAAGSSLRSTLAAEGAPGTLVFNTTGTGKPVITFPGGASAAVFGPNPRQQSLAYATLDDNIVHVYDFYSSRNFPLSGATGRIEGLAFDDSGAYIAAGGEDDMVRVYSAISGGQPVQTLAGHTGRVVSVGFADGAQYVASSSDDGTTRLWQGPNPTPSAQRTNRPFGDAGVPASGFTQNGSRIVIGGGGPTLAASGQILNANSLATQATFSLPAGQVLAGDLISHDGRTIVALAAVKRGTALAGVAIDTFDAHTGAHLATMIPGGGRGLLDGSLNYAGTEVATLESGGRVELWTARTGRLLHVLAGDTGNAPTVLFSHDGSLVAVAHDPVLPTPLPAKINAFGPVVIQLWDTATGRLVRTIQAQRLTTQIPGEAAFSPLGLAVSPDDRTLAVSGAQPDVQLFSVATGATDHPPLPLEGESGGSYAADLAFSPNGRLLAAGSAAGAYVWQLPSYQQQPVFQHTTASSPIVVPGSAQVRVAFTNDSLDLMTFGELRLEAWSIADHLQLFATPADFPISSGQLAPDGRSLVTTSALGGVTVYPCSLCGGLHQLLTVASQRVTRELTPGERSRYLGAA